MSDDLERIKAKIAKLLALAESDANEHEAANAAAKARTLMDKYQLDLLDIQPQSEREDIVEQSHPYMAGRWPVWMASMASSVATLNDCYVVYGTYGAAKQLVFRGFASDVTLSMEMYDYLVATVRRMSEAYRIETSARHAQCEHYRLGLSRSIRARLDAITANRLREQISGSGTSLVVVKTDLVKQKFGEAKYGKGTRKQVEDESLLDALRDGLRDGRTVKLQDVVQ